MDYNQKYNLLQNYKMSEIHKDTSQRSTYKRNKIMTLIGCILIQLAAGVVPIWGNANIYFLSYFKNNGEVINKNTNSYILIAIVLPMSVMIVFATKLSNRFGFTNVIKACSIIFFFSHLMIYISFNIYTCTIFLLLIPLTANSLSFIPMYNCLWSYFLQKKSTISGFAAVCYGISGAILNIAFIHMVNPQNIQAKNNDNGFVYFDQSVTNNLIPATRIIFFTVAVIFVVGAWMVHKQDQNGTEAERGTENANMQENDKHIELKQQAQFQIQEQNQNQMKRKQQNQQNKQKQMVQMCKYGSPQPILSKQISVSSSSTVVSNQSISIKQYLLDWRFITIFTNVLFIDFYIVFLLNNFKIIYLQRINDDHFLGYCLIVNTVTALIGTFLWGWLADRLKLGKTMMYLIIVDFIIKIIGIFSTTKTTLLILMFLIGFTSRGMTTVAGPGLIEVFGLKIATELLPIKALAVIGSFILIPIFQLIFLRFMTPFTFMNIMVFINVFIAISTYYFIKNFKPYHQQQQKDIRTTN